MLAGTQQAFCVRFFCPLFSTLTGPILNKGFSFIPLDPPPTTNHPLTTRAPSRRTPGRGPSQDTLLICKAHFLIQQTSPLRASAVTFIYKKTINLANMWGFTASKQMSDSSQVTSGTHTRDLQLHPPWDQDRMALPVSAGVGGQAVARPLTRAQMSALRVASQCLTDAVATSSL